MNKTTVKRRIQFIHRDICQIAGTFFAFQIAGVGGWDFACLFCFCHLLSISCCLFSSLTLALSIFTSSLCLFLPRWIQLPYLGPNWAKTVTFWYLKNIVTPICSSLSVLHLLKQESIYLIKVSRDADINNMLWLCFLIFFKATFAFFFPWRNCWDGGLRDLL